MRRHPKGIALICLTLLLALGFGVVYESLYLALVSLLGGFVMLVLMLTAWMRPPGYPEEHHPRVDRLFDDTRP